MTADAAIESPPDVVSSVLGRTITKSTLLSMSGQVGSILAGALLSIFLARMLGPQGFGDFSYAYTLLLIAVIPAKLGLDTTAMKLTASYERTSDYRRLHGFFKYSIRRCFELGAFLALALAALLLSASERIDARLLPTLIAAACCIPALGILHILGYFLYGLRRYLLGQLPEAIARPLILTIVIAILISHGIPATATLAMILNTALTAALCVASFILVRRLLPQATFSVEPQYERETWSKTGNAMLMISGLNLVLAQTDIVLLGTLAGTYEAGLYSAAAKVAMLTLFFYTAINSIAAPIISRAFVANETAQLSRLSSLCARIIILSSAIVTVGAIAFGKYILSLFGPEFLAAYPVLVILSLAQMLKSVSGIGGFLLTMTSHEAASARLSLLAASVNLALAFIFIPRFGALGASMGTLFATFAWSLGVIIVVRRRIGINCCM
jgi:O-antigen/teichoic acid export membrane protein